MYHRALKSSLSKDAYITKLGPDDILCGRGSGPNDHEGNIRFRSLIAKRESEYRSTSNRLAKTKIAQDVINEVFKKNGRFLKKVGASEARRVGIPKGVDAYVTASDDTIMEKVKQALRQNRDKSKAISPIKILSQHRASMSKKQQPPETVTSAGQTYQGNNGDYSNKLKSETNNRDAKLMQPPARRISPNRNSSPKRHSSPSRYPTLPKELSDSLSKLHVSEDMSTETVGTIDKPSSRRISTSRYPTNKIDFSSLTNLMESGEMSMDSMGTIEHLSSGDSGMRAYHMSLLKAMKDSKNSMQGNSFRTKESHRSSLISVDESFDTHIFSNEVSEEITPKKKSSMVKQTSVRTLPPIEDVDFQNRRSTGTASYAGSMISNLSLAASQIYAEVDKQILDADYPPGDDFREDFSRMSFMTLSDRNLDDYTNYTQEPASFEKDL